jgi:hypothetical protein
VKKRLDISENGRIRDEDAERRGLCVKAQRLRMMIRRRQSDPHQLIGDVVTLGRAVENLACRVDPNLADAADRAMSDLYGCIAQNVVFESQVMSDLYERETLDLRTRTADRLSKYKVRQNESLPSSRARGPADGAILLSAHGGPKK